MKIYFVQGISGHCSVQAMHIIH